MASRWSPARCGAAMGRSFPSWLGWALTVLFVLATGVIFRAGSVEAAWHVFSGLASALPLDRGTASVGTLVVAPLFAFLLPASQDIVADASPAGRSRALAGAARPWTRSHCCSAWVVGISMSSSTSSSDADPGWGRSLQGVPGHADRRLPLLVLALMVVWSTPTTAASLALLGIDGVDNRLTQITAASRCRDPGPFQRRHPRQLDGADDRAGGAVARDGLALRAALYDRLRVRANSSRVLDFFLRNHEEVGALVIAGRSRLVRCMRGRRRRRSVPCIGSTTRASSPTRCRLISWQAIEQAFQRLEHRAWPAAADESGRFRQL